MSEYLDYDLKIVKGRSITRDNAPEVLRAVADFIAGDGEQTFTFLGVNVNYDVEDDMYTAHVMYEG